MSFKKPTFSKLTKLSELLSGALEVMIDDSETKITKLKSVADSISKKEDLKTKFEKLKKENK